MPRTAGATDKTQRTRRKQTDTEKEQRKEALNAKKQKEKKEAERLRPANTSSCPAVQFRSVVMITMETAITASVIVQLSSSNV